MTIRAGHELLHYRVIEKIGQGGMGDVYVAEDTKLHRRVALKVLPREMAADANRLTRFEREARAVASLNHPNIVTLHSVEQAPSTSSGQAPSIHFITMELVEGKTLGQLIPGDGFPLSQLLEIAIPLADAVAAAHRAGITHRDLKPDNIMFDAEGRLRVLDFGLAKLHDRSGFTSDKQEVTATAVTEEGKILGTVAYMSPEQAEGKEVDPRSDIFSLGIILYEMVTGGRPFRGDTNISTIGAILKDEPTPVMELKPALPTQLGRIIRRCLAKAPDRRYETAVGLRNELEELKSEIDSGEHHHAATPATRPAMSRTLFGVLAVTVVVAIFAIWQSRQSDAPSAGYTSRPLTSAIGWESDISWSPESEFIAFAQMREGSLDIMVQPVAAGQAKVRVDGPGDQHTPRWSPDGRYLAYVSTADPGSFVNLVPPHGGTPRKLIATNIPTLDTDKSSAAMGNHPWSKDGKALLVSIVADTGQMAIHRVDRETGESQPITSPPPGGIDLEASYSSDGKRILFHRRVQGKGSLLIIPATGGDPEILLEDEFDNHTPSWRPDDRHIVFLSTRGAGAANLWEIDTSTGKIWQLTAETNNLVGFAISRDNRIAYVPFWHDTFLHVVHVASGEKRQLTFHTKDNFGGRFSPDDRSIAYHSTRTGNSEIWLYHLDGRPETQVTEDDGWDLYPDWSPDGERLIFVSDRNGGQFKIFIANSDGGGERLLVDRRISVHSPWTPVNSKLVSRWSPEGDQLAFLVTGEKTNVLWTIQPDGEGARELQQNVLGFDWYLDNRRAIITRPHGSSSAMVAVNLETGEEQVLFEGPLTEMDVAPDGSSVAFCFGRGHMGMGLVVLKLDPPSVPGGLPRAAGPPQVVVPAEGIMHIHNGGWSADSKSLVYTRDTDYGDIFELVERR